MCPCSFSIFQAEASGALCECSARFKEGACVRLYVYNVVGLGFKCGKGHQHKNCCAGKMRTDPWTVCVWGGGGGGFGEMFFLHISVAVLCCFIHQYPCSTCLLPDMSLI